MATLRRARTSRDVPRPFMTTRTAVIVLVASVVSLGVGAAAACAAYATGVGPAAAAAIGFGALASSMVANISTLHGLIADD